MGLRRPTDKPISELIDQAEKRIFAQYGDVVSVARKSKTLFKFGENPDVGTAYETVWATGGDEAYVFTNAITHYSSSDASDDQLIDIQGFTIDANYKLIYVTQQVTLAGQTKSALTTPLARVVRVANFGSTDMAGTIYIYEDDTVVAGVPQTASAIHITVTAPQNQTLKCATCTSDKEYWIITDLTVGVKRTNNAAADFEIQVREVTSDEYAFRSVLFLSASQAGPLTLNIDPPLIVPRNYDIRVRAIASANATSVSAGLNGYLAQVIGRKDGAGRVVEVA